MTKQGGEADGGVSVCVCECVCGEGGGGGSNGTADAVALLQHVLPDSIFYA